MYDDLEMGGADDGTVQVRRYSLQRLLNEVSENGNVTAARLLTRALKRSLIQRALITWVSSGKTYTAGSYDHGTCHQICVLLYEFWFAQRDYVRALNCVSYALLYRTEASTRYVDLSNQIQICYALGQYERVIPFITELFRGLNLDIAQSVSQLSTRLESLPLSPAELLDLHLLKCRAFIGARKPKAAESYFSVARAYATANGIRLPDWRPEDSDGDRISCVVCTASEPSARAM